MTKVNASIQNLKSTFKKIGVSDTENDGGYVLMPKTAAGKEIVFFLPPVNRLGVKYTKKTRPDFMRDELLPNLMDFKGAKYSPNDKAKSSAGAITFAGTQIYIIAKLIESKGAGASKGVAFEAALEKDFKSMMAGSNKFIYLDFMKEFEDVVLKTSLKNAKITGVEGTGKENTPRPLKFDAEGIYCSVKGAVRNTSIGEGLADLKVTTNKGVVNLSAKFGNTVTFFNSGIGKNTFPPGGAFPDEFFEKGVLNKDSPGQAILDLFGLDKTLFRNVFTSYKEKTIAIKKQKAPKSLVKVAISGKRKTELVNFLKTIIGKDYWLLHLDNQGKVHMFEMTEKFLNDASNITSSHLTIEYPQKGSAKRIDIKLETKLYSLNFNIRSKQAGATYPTHMMCDYKFKH